MRIEPGHVCIRTPWSTVLADSNFKKDGRIDAGNSHISGRRVDSWQDEGPGRRKIREAALQKGNYVYFYLASVISSEARMGNHDFFSAQMMSL